MGNGGTSECAGRLKKGDSVVGSRVFSSSDHHIVMSWQDNPDDGDQQSPRRDKDPQFDFQTFLDQMKSRGAEPVAKYLRSQVTLTRPSHR